MRRLRPVSTFRARIRRSASTPLREHRAHVPSSAPAHQLLHQRLANARPDRRACAHRRCRSRALRACRTSTCCERSPQLLGRGLHQRAVRRHAHRQFRSRASRPSPCSFDRTSTAAAMPGDDDLTRRVEVRGLHHFALRSFAQAASTRASSSPRIAAIAPCPAGTASCMAWPRNSRAPPPSENRAHRSRPVPCTRRGCGRPWRPAGAAVLAPDAPDRNARREHRGLCALGRIQSPSGPAWHSFHKS